MKTEKSLSFVLLVAVLLLPFTGCKKASDYFNSGPVKDLKICNIKKIISPNNDWEEAYFSYNKWGNPEKVIMKRNSKGSPNFFFRYDNKQRLIMVMNSFKTELVDGDDIFEFENLTYNNDGSINDTVFSVGFYKAGQPIPNRSSDYYTKHIYFDAMGRVNRVSEEFGWRDQDIYFYYDERGNRSKVEYLFMGNETGFVYDNNTNFMRTNKVWMFLSCDYSVNNRYNASTVSCSGLPVSFSIPKNDYIGFRADFFGRYQPPLGKNIKIEYMCDCGTYPAE